MQTADNFSYVIPVDDTIHTDVEIARVAQHVQDGLLTPEEATDFVFGKKV